MYDTEGTGLVQAWDNKRKQYHHEIDKFWVISLKDIDSGVTYTFHHGQGKEWWLPALELMSNAKELLCHNQIDFDLPALLRVHGWSPGTACKIIDTLVLSRLFNPDRDLVDGCSAGPHSVEAWGRRLGIWKPEQEQWLKWEPSMINRCQKDVEIQCAMYEALMQEKGRGAWNKAIAVEHESARIMTQQRLNGVYVDQEHAKECTDDLTQCIETVTESLIKLAPTRPTQFGVTVDEPFTKQGRLKKLVTDWCDRDCGVDESLDPDCVCGPHTRVQWDLINLNSYPQLNEWLLSVGWKPTDWNYKKVTENESRDTESPYYGQRPKQFALDSDNERVRSSPKLTEDSFDSIPGVVGQEIKARFRYTKRLALFAGVLQACRPDGRVPAMVNPLGTNTSRMKHQVVANIPKAKGADLPVTNKCFYGTQCRELFSSPGDRVLVGHDASGLELRMLAHYMNDTTYTEILLNGDIHEYNLKPLLIFNPLATRDDAKTFVYAFNYGAGLEKLGSIVGGSADDGALLKAQFLRENPVLDRLIKHVKKASRKGWLKGLDGRKVPMREFDGRVQEHKALNTLLQSAGAVVMTYSRVLLDKWVREEGLDVIKVIDYHDEAEAEVSPEHAERYAELAVKSIIQTGIDLKLNLPLDAEAKIGKTWADVH